LQSAIIEDVTTLYIRDVSDETAAKLKERAAGEGMSLSAYVGVQLAKIADRPTNAEIVAELRSLNRDDAPSTDDILTALREGRAGR